MTAQKMISASRTYNKRKSEVGVKRSERIMLGLEIGGRKSGVCPISLISPMKKNQAFTLIEVLVAATIIAVLTSIGVVSYQRANRHSRNSRRKSDLEQIRSALEMYRADEDEYPSFGCTAVSNSLIPADYMADIPTDPKTGNAYQYKETANGYCVSARMETPKPDGDTCTNGCASTNWGLKAP